MLDSDPPALRVLCVDDNRDAAESLGILLGAGGLRVAGLLRRRDRPGGGRACLPDAYILDLNMPGMDGDELGRKLRGLRPGRLTPLVAVTAMGDDEARRRTTAAGFDLHLTKPIDPDRLANVLADIVILRGDSSWAGDAAATDDTPRPTGRLQNPPDYTTFHG